MAGIDGIDDVVLDFYGQLRLRRFCRFAEHLDALRLDEFEFIIEGGLPFVDHFLECIDILLGQGDDGLGLEGNGVAHVAAMPAGQPGVKLLDSLAYNLNHHLVGIAATFVDLQTAVSATQALDHNAHGYVLGIGIHLLVFQCGGDVDTAS